MKISKNNIQNLAIAIGVFCLQGTALLAQETMPVPGTPTSVTVPAVTEKKLPNGLTIAVVERKNVPLVTVQLLVKSGANSENAEHAGLANLTASLLTKGTKTRTATQIAEQMEFLGGSINTGAGWNSSNVTINVMSDKLDPAMAILSDVVLQPSFQQDEIKLLKSQTLDNLSYNLQQPGFLASYVASAYSYKEHPAGGTPSSINKIGQQDIIDFHKKAFTANNAVLVFSGDITPGKANLLAQKYFAQWSALGSKAVKVTAIPNRMENAKAKSSTKRILVVDLPDAGQAAVKYVQDLKVGRIEAASRKSAKAYYPAIVLNSILGGGYSSRLNQEIRIKRGLSYGAFSGFSWRNSEANFGASTQTKNESAAEVAALLFDEVGKLADKTIEPAELNPRKLALTGDFGRNLETTDGLAGAIAELYAFGLAASELNGYMPNVEAISDSQVRDFAKANLTGGDIIIVGDHAKFAADLSKRFPDLKIEVIKAADIDLTKMN
jgi:zinc protease